MCNVYTHTLRTAIKYCFRLEDFLAVKILTKVFVVGHHGNECGYLHCVVVVIYANMGHVQYSRQCLIYSGCPI